MRRVSTASNSSVYSRAAVRLGLMTCSFDWCACMMEFITQAQVTPSYDVAGWDEILDVHDCPRISYDITILVLWSHWIRCVCDASGTIIGKSSDILRPSYDSRTMSYDFTTIVCREADIIVGSRGKVMR